MRNTYKNVTKINEKVTVYNKSTKKEEEYTRSYIEGVTKPTLPDDVVILSTEEVSREEVRLVLSPEAFIANATEVHEEA